MLPTIVVQPMLIKLIMLLSVVIPKLLAPFDSSNFTIKFSITLRRLGLIVLQILMLNYLAFTLIFSVQDHFIPRVLV